MSSALILTFPVVVGPVGEFGLNVSRSPNESTTVHCVVDGHWMAEAMLP